MGLHTQTLIEEQYLQIMFANTTEVALIIIGSGGGRYRGYDDKVSGLVG